MADKEYVIGLIKKFQAGEKDVFEEIYNETYRLVYTTCYGHLNSAEDAEDVTQEVFLAVYKGLDSLTAPEAYSSWMVRIASLKSIDCFRKRKDIVFTDNDAELDAFTGDWEEVDQLPDSFIEEEEKAQIINKVMRESLSDVQYQTLFMHYYDDMKIPEIAQQMNCAEGTVKTRLMSARSKFKEALSSYVDENKLVLAAAPFFTRLFTRRMSNVRIPNPPAFKIPVAKGVIDTANAVTEASKAAGKAARGGLMAGNAVKIVAGAVALAVAGGIGGFFIYRGVKASKHKIIPLSEYVTYSVDGYSDQAEVKYKLDYDKLLNDYPEIEGVSREQIEGMIGGQWNKTNNISNGDEIVFTWVENDELAKVEEDNNVEFKMDDIVYKVDGLDDQMVIDPFDYINVIFEGTSPYGTARIEFRTDMPHYGELTCKLSKASLLSTGDTVTVTVSCGDGKYVLLRDTKDYTVEGLLPNVEVKTAETFKIGGYSYDVPEILIDGLDMRETNAKISKDLSEYKDCAMDEYGYCYYYGASYKYYIGERAVSIVVHVLEEFNCDEYYIYNISCDDGRIMSRKEFLELIEMSDDELKDSVYKSVKAHMDEINSLYEYEIYPTNLAGFNVYKHNLRDEAIEAAEPYYDENGDLSYLCEITGAGGADYYLTEIKAVD